MEMEAFAAELFRQGRDRWTVTVAGGTLAAVGAFGITIPTDGPWPAVAVIVTALACLTVLGSYELWQKQLSEAEAASQAVTDEFAYARRRLQEATPDLGLHHEPILVTVEVYLPQLRPALTDSEYEFLREVSFELRDLAGNAYLTIMGNLERRNGLRDKLDQAVASLPSYEIAPGIGHLPVRAPWDRKRCLPERY
jgi:hypothetical protein